MEKTIQLQFKDSITRLAGNLYGQEIYNTQVKSKVDLEGINKIIIPEQIEDIAISFVQGFTLDIFNFIDKDRFFEVFIIEANNKVINKFKKSIYF